MLARRRQRVPDPLPYLALVPQRRLSLDQRQRTLDVRPAPEDLTPEHELGTRIEYSQQVPKLAHLGLDGRCGTKQ